MWDPQHLTTILVSTACYGNSFALLLLVVSADLRPKWWLMVLEERLFHGKHNERVRRDLRSSTTVNPRRDRTALCVTAVSRRHHGWPMWDRFLSNCTNVNTWHTQWRHFRGLWTWCSPLCSCPCVCVCVCVWTGERMRPVCTERGAADSGKCRSSVSKGWPHSRVLLQTSTALILVCDMFVCNAQRASTASYRDSFGFCVEHIFIVCNVTFIVCVALCSMVCLSLIVLFCVICVFLWVVPYFSTTATG
jgi:hypothetical protein